MTTFKNKQELLEWHLAEAKRFRDYEAKLRAEGKAIAEGAALNAQLHESAVEVLETLE